MLPVERAALKWVPGQVYNKESLFRRCTLMVEHDKRSERVFFFLLWWIDRRHKLFYNTHKARRLRRDVMIFWLIVVKTDKWVCAWSGHFSLKAGRWRWHNSARLKQIVCLFNLKIYSIAKIQYMAQLLLRICFTVMYKMHKKLCKMSIKQWMLFMVH